MCLLSGVVLHEKGRGEKVMKGGGWEGEEHNDRETLQWFSGNAFKTYANMCSVYRVTHLTLWLGLLNPNILLEHFQRGRRVIGVALPP